MTIDTEILLVLDTAFGDHALEYSKDCPIWAVSSPANLLAADHARKNGRSFTVLTVKGDTPEVWLMNHIDSVDQHYNEFSQRPGYSVLRVVGVSLSPQVQSYLGEFGFVHFNSEPEGFCARKT